MYINMYVCIVIETVGRVAKHRNAQSIPEPPTLQLAEHIAKYHIRHQRCNTLGIEIYFNNLEHIHVVWFVTY